MDQLVRLTRSLHPLVALAGPLAALAACDDSRGYVVRAEAELAPIDGSGIRGALVFGHGKGYPDGLDASPTELELADGDPHRIMVLDADDCGVDRAAARVFDPPPAAVAPARPDGDLGSIRRAEDGVWFWHPASLPEDPADGAFVQNKLIGSMTADAGRAGSMLGKIVVVRARNADATPGAWQACGRIVAASYEL